MGLAVADATLARKCLCTCLAPRAAVSSKDFAGQDSSRSFRRATIMRRTSVRMFDDLWCDGKKRERYKIQWFWLLGSHNRPGSFFTLSLFLEP